MNKNQYSKGIYYILLLFAIIALGVFLKLSVSFTLPVTVAILISCVFYPVVKRLNQKAKMPWILGTLIMALIFLVIVIALVAIMGKSLTTIVSQYPKYESTFNKIYMTYADAFKVQFNQEANLFENLWGQLKVREFVQSAAVTFSSNLIILFKNLAMILLLSVFLLIEMKNGHEKVDAMFQGKIQGRVTSILKKTITDIVHYMSIKFFISLATGVLVFLTALIFRLDFAIMWGVLAFIMNFIPTFGSIISVGLTSIFALIQFYPNPFPILMVLFLMTAINLILGNIIEPRIEGKNLGISPFIILVSLTFWGWMWGFVGMILAVPMMVTIKIICENVSYLHPFAILLGNAPTDTKLELSEVENEDDNDEETD